MGARPVSIEEAAEERVVLGLPGLEDLDTRPVGEPELGGPEADVEAARVPFASELRRRSAARRRTSVRRRRPRGRGSAPAMVGAPAQVAVRHSACPSPPRGSGGTDRGGACYAWGMDFRREALSRPGRRRAFGNDGAPASSSPTPWSASRRSTPQVNAFVAVDVDDALEAAARIDDAVAGGGGPRSSGGHPHRREGPGRRGRFRHLARIGGLRRWPAAAVGLAPGGAPAGGGVRRGGQDQHPRARVEGRHRQRHVRPDVQSVEPGPTAPAARRADRRRPSRRAWSRSPRDPTGVDRSASPRRVAA